MSSGEFPAWFDDVDPRFLAALEAWNGPVPHPDRTLGPEWIDWIETNCVMGEGDLYKQPVRLQPEQKATLWYLGEVEETGLRRYSFAVISFGKGGGKSPFGAWIGSLELAGPAVVCEGCRSCDRGWFPDGAPHAVRRNSPNVINMASTYDQANLILNEATVTWEKGPLSEYATCGKGEITLRAPERGTFFRIPATPKRADGTKATTLIVDEFHEFTGEANERAYAVASAGTAKRKNGLVLILSTAGFDQETMFGKMMARMFRGEYARHEFVLCLQAGSLPRPSRTDDLSIVNQATCTLDATNREDIATGIMQANPLAMAGVADVNNLVSKFMDMPMFRAVRYYWNRWTRTGESWLQQGAWEACRGEVKLVEGYPTWMGADMAQTQDSASVVIIQQLPDGKIQAHAKIWVPDGQRIPQVECDDYIRKMREIYQPAWIAVDQAWWPTLPELESEGLPIFRLAQNGRYMVEAYNRAYSVIHHGSLVHDGSPDFSDQISSAVPQSTESGWKLKKGKMRRRIDSAPALAMALFAMTVEPEPVEDIPPSEIYFVELS